MCKLYIFLGIGILLAIVLLSRLLSSIQPKVELFKANSNITNQSPMNFGYLTDPNYSRNILATYYLDDDKKINGQRVVNHPFMYKYGPPISAFIAALFSRGRYYEDVSNKTYGYYWWWPERSNDIYKSSGVRL